MGLGTSRPSPWRRSDPIASPRLSFGESWANVCGDISASAGNDSSLFKQMTGDDPIYGERKFGQPFDFTCGAMPFWSCNIYPRSQDVSAAYMNRWSVVHFERQFEENAAKEAQLKALASDQQEMQGLLAVAVRNAVYLLAQPKPVTDSVPQSMKNALMRFQQNTDTVRAFADEALKKTAGRIDGKEAYDWYRAYCEGAGMGKVGRNKFYERMEALEGIGVIRPGNKLTFTGVELDETWTAESGAQQSDFHDELTPILARAGDDE